MENSREESPDLGKKKSRRKPVVTRKIEAEDEEQLETFDGETSFDLDQVMSEVDSNDRMDGIEEEQKKIAEDFVNGDKEKSSDKRSKEPSKKAEDFVIPEGTVIVEPEPVEDTKQKEFTGPEWKATKRLSRSAALGIVVCTACNKQINTNQNGAAKRHPVLKVLICRRCYSWYASAEIEQDSDGMDEQCRWCGDGGNLICCDFCHNAFCKGCIKKNLGRKELSDIVDAGDDDKWHCYVCDPKPLAALITECSSLLESIDKVNNPKKEQPKKVHKQTEPVVKRFKTTPVAKKSTTQVSKVVNSSRFEKTVVKTPKGTVVLPPGAIPVKTVMNSSGNQVIVLQQPMPQQAPTVVGTKVSKQSPTSFARANAEQLRIIGDAVKNVSLTKTSKAVNQGQRTTSKSPSVPVVAQKSANKPIIRYEWEAPINEYNVSQTLDRTLAVTESLRMVMVSMKEDMRKANQMPVTQCLEKKRLIGSKLKRAMGAFKKQIQDIELFCRSTYKHVATTKPPNKAANKPFPVSLSKSKNSPQAKPSSKSNDVEVIELSSSDDEESTVSVNRHSSNKEMKSGNANKEKKGITVHKGMDLKLADTSERSSRKRKHHSESNDTDMSATKDTEPDDKKVKTDDKMPEELSKTETALKANENESSEETVKNSEEPPKCNDKDSLSERTKNSEKTLKSDKKASGKPDEMCGEDETESKDKMTAVDESEGSSKNSPGGISLPDQDSESDTEVLDNAQNTTEQTVSSPAKDETIVHNGKTTEQIIQSLAKDKNSVHEDQTATSPAKENSSVHEETADQTIQSPAKDDPMVQEENTEEQAGTSPAKDEREHVEKTATSPVGKDDEIVQDGKAPDKAEGESDCEIVSGCEQETKEQEESKRMETSVQSLESVELKKDEDMDSNNESMKEEDDIERLLEPESDTAREEKSKYEIKPLKVVIRKLGKGISRSEMEAQRELHKQLLQDESSSQESPSEDDESDDYVRGSRRMKSKQHGSKNTDSKKIKFSRRHKINSEKKKEPTDSESESDTEVSSSHNKQTTKLSPKHQNGRQNKAVLENSSTLSKKTRSQNEQSDKSAKHKRHSSSRDSDHKIKKVQKVHQSDSSNYDSDLERDIERLAHVPQKSSKTSLKKQKKSESEGEEEVNKEQNQKAGRKVKQKDRRFEDLSSGEESESNQSVDEDTEDNNTDLQEAGDLALKALEEGNFFDLERDRSDDELITCESEARKAMLADHSSSSDSPDSDVDAILAKKLKGVSGSKGSSKSNSVHVSDTESTSTNKTSKKYNRLLDARLSDLEDIDSPLKSDKKDRGLEKDDSQSEDDLDNGHLSSDSDFAILSKSPKSTKKRGSDSESENKSEDSRGSDSDLSSDFEPKPKTRAKKKKSETSDSEVDSDESKNTKKKKVPTATLR